MAVPSGRERVNIVTEVQDRFRGVWPSLRSVYTEKFGNIENWPATGQNTDNPDIVFVPRARKLQIKTPVSRVEVIFSKQDDDVAGLTVVSQGREDYIGVGMVRETVSYGSDNYPARTHMWHLTGDLKEVRAFLDEEVGFKYYGDEPRPWERIMVRVRNPRKHLSPDFERRFPRTLLGHTALDGREIPWKLDVVARAEDVISKSGIRKLRSVGML